MTQDTKAARARSFSPIGRETERHRIKCVTASAKDARRHQSFPGPLALTLRPVLPQSLGFLGTTTGFAESGRFPWSSFAPPSVKFLISDGCFRLSDFA